MVWASRHVAFTAAGPHAREAFSCGMAGVYVIDGLKGDSMKPDLQKIIERKNERREDDMVRSAEHIIENIIAEQQKITAAQNRIEELRSELRALEMTPIDASAVLGN